MVNLFLIFFQTDRESSGSKNGDFIDRLIEMKATVTKQGIITEDQIAAQVYQIIQIKLYIYEYIIYFYKYENN